MLRYFRLVSIFIILLLLTGCWDRVEIEERGFVVGVGVELMTEEEQEEHLDTLPNEKLEGKYPIKETLQFVVPSGLTAPTQGGGKGGGSGASGGKAYMNVTGVGDSALEISRNFANNVSRTPYYEHLKVIVISEEAARKPYLLSSMLDFYLRDNEMRRATKLLIAKRPIEILEVNEPTEKLPVLYLDSLTENDYKASTIVPLNRIGDIQEKLLSNQSFTLQYVKNHEKGARLSGAAVFQSKDNHMVGKLTTREVKGNNFILGKVKGGIVKINYKGNIMVFEVSRAKSHITGNVSNKKNMEFHVKIEAEGQIEETFRNVDLKDPKEIKAIQKAIEKEIVDIANETINKSKKLHAEVVGLSNYLIRNHYDVWEKIQNDWDNGENYFQDSKINVEAEVNVRSTGTLFKSSK